MLDEVLKLFSPDNPVFVALLSLLVSVGATQIVKLVFDGLLKAKKIKKEPWFRDASLRLLSVVSGALVGLLLPDKAFGVVLGMAVGATNTFLFALAKKQIKKHLEK